MKKSDFSPEELDELIVAFADDELDGDQKKFIEDLISSDPDVNQQFLEFQNSGEMLRAFFDVEKVSTPEHVKQEIMNYALATKPNNIVSFPQRIKQAVNNNFRIQNLTQIAAALVIGAFFGPSLFQSVGEDPLVGGKIPLTLRGNDKIVIEASAKTEGVLSILVQSNGDDFDLQVEAGGILKANQPFIIQFRSPIEGEALIYEEKDANLGNSLGGIDKNILFLEQVLKGQMLELPKEGAFSLSDQTSFTIIGEFSNTAEKQYFRSVYNVQ
tara:strand:+ start:428 stop:1237 length:810 start_codon:yes stop_codon:yes gene_type:complete